MKKAIWLICSSGLAMMLGTLGGMSVLEAATYDCQVAPHPGDAPGEALYRVWIPDETPQIRGILFRQHGCGTGARALGLEHADDIQWQALAQKHGFALMGSQVFAPDEDCSTWTMPEDGSARAFLEAIRILAEAAGHPELNTVPWCLWGHSGGAIWTMNMTYLFPERVIAAFPRSGGLAPEGKTYLRTQPQAPDSNPAALKVPILFCFGEKEAIQDNRFYKLIQGVYQVFEFGRRQRAPWALAVHPGAEHENGQSRQIAIRFFDTIIPLRLPVSPPGTMPVLKKLPEKNHWVGMNQGHEIMEQSICKEPPHTSSYLADPRFARAWKYFQASGKIPDNTAPVPPHALRVECKAKEATLHWNAFADIESGIQNFRIYHRGHLIGEVAGKTHPTWNPSGAFHAWNYSDQPLEGKTLPAMTFIHRNQSESHPEAYTVSTVNQAGLESDTTQGISLPAWRKRQATPWRSLSDADYLEDWQGPSGTPPMGWRFENDILSMHPGREDTRHTSLYTKEIYEDFEFRFQFRIGSEGNSGVKFRMADYEGKYLGPEYQILDDARQYPGYDPGHSSQRHSITGSLYLLEPGDWQLDSRHPPGTWNEGRIISTGVRIEQWLNGVRIVETRTDTSTFLEAVQASKFKKWAHYGQNTRGRIMLQDHGTKVEFRRLEIKAFK
jgi:hypothetical protein